MPETPKVCFVASPIGEPNTPERIHADWLYQGIIQPVFEDYRDYQLLRADKITTPGMIDSQVINHLHDDALVILDMSFQNANVFYEMGIRHMKQLPTIHMFRDDQKIPFDVKPYRAIAFNYEHPDQLTKAQAALKAVIEEVIKPDFTVENPVTRARGFDKLQELATSTERLLATEMESLKERQMRTESLLDRTMTIVGTLLNALSAPVSSSDVGITPFLKTTPKPTVLGALLGSGPTSTHTPPQHGILSPLFDEAKKKDQSK